MQIINRGYDPAVPVGSLKIHPQNPREGDIGAICQSIDANGFYGALVVQWEKGTILAGNHRLRSAIEKGADTVPVIWVECDDATAQRILLADNRTNDLASYNEPALAELLQAIGKEQGTLEGTGYDNEALGNLLADLTQAERLAASEEDEKAPEAPETAVTCPGDVWLLGQHRLLCGDATVITDVERVMGGDQGDMVFTDPPYNVNYEGYTADKLTIQSDKMAPEAFRQFLMDAFISYRTVVKTGASLYVCHSSSMQRELQGALETAGFEVRCQIIWAKNTFAWGFGRYKFQHEPIFYAHVAKQSDAWYGDLSQSTLWQENKPAANRLHPTMKPVELVLRALVNSSKAGDVVVDLFGGSGSTLIACEKAGRNARLLELDPKYCDVIVKRWQGFTNLDARLEGEDNRTFAELAAERLPSKTGP